MQFRFEKASVNSTFIDENKKKILFIPFTVENLINLENLNYNDEKQRKTLVLLIFT